MPNDANVAGGNDSLTSLYDITEKLPGMRVVPSLESAEGRPVVKTSAGHGILPMPRQHLFGWRGCKTTYPAEDPESLAHRVPPPVASLLFVFLVLIYQRKSLTANQP